MAHPPETSVRSHRSRLARERVARVQGDLLSRWRDDLGDVIGLMTSELKNYRRGYDADFEGRWEACPLPVLEEALSRADVIFSGDYHTLPAAQRLLLRLLRRTLPAEERETILALEMLHSEDQPIVDRYLAGRLGLEALRKEIAFDHRWGFEWRHYGALLRFARDRGIAVRGINVEPGIARGRLRARDEHAARVLAQLREDHPRARLHVLAGDWHVARAHLPRAFRRQLLAHGLVPARIVILHQNHERLHERLVRPADAAAVARRGDDLFCVLNATPLVKADSDRIWASRHEESAPPPGDVAEWPLFDPVTAFHEVDEVLVRHFALPRPRHPLIVCGAHDDEAIERTGRRAGATREMVARWRRRLDEGGTVRVPRAGALLVGHTPIHRLAEEATRHRLDARSGARRDPLAAFHRRILVEGAVFFSSRAVNPDRKCPLFADWNARRHGVTGGWITAWARAAAVRSDRLPFTEPDHPFRAATGAIRTRVARAIGAIWGWYLFGSWLNGDVPPDRIRKLFIPDRSAEEDVALLRDGIAAWPESVRTQSKDSLL